MGWPILEGGGALAIEKLGNLVVQSRFTADHYKYLTQ